METLNFSGRSSFSPSKGAGPAWGILEQKDCLFAELDARSKDQVARSLAPRVKSIALHLKSRLPGHVEVSELISAGTLGLMEALGKFRPDMGIRFENFAETRIRGAMLDELRRMDWFSRGLRQKVKKLEQVIRVFEQKNGRAPSREELEDLSEERGEELESTLEALRSQVLLSLDAVQENGMPVGRSLDGEPYASVALQDILGKLGQLIERLNEREQLVLSLYYKEEMNMKEVAATLEVTEGRISQIHSQALGKLRNFFRKEHGEA